jgi:hypothetical protein
LWSSNLDASHFAVREMEAVKTPPTSTLRCGPAQEEYSWIGVAHGTHFDAQRVSRDRFGGVGALLIPGALCGGAYVDRRAHIR